MKFKAATAKFGKPTARPKQKTKRKGLAKGVAFDWPSLEAEINEIRVVRETPRGSSASLDADHFQRLMSINKRISPTRTAEVAKLVKEKFGIKGLWGNDLIGALAHASAPNLPKVRLRRLVGASKDGAKRNLSEKAAHAYFRGWSDGNAD